MKAIVVMFDSLNRHMLPPYGCDWVQAPNFSRLAQRCVTFGNSYVGSMPCMPARREFHTGRPNFLHRSWGPLEPFDDSCIRMLRDAGVHTHLVTDHYHYWEAGGATYHVPYSSYEFFRGQEGDLWKGQVTPPPMGESLGCNAKTSPWHVQDRINRTFCKEESDWPQAQTFQAGLDYIDRNAGDGNWLLQIETFDPHEPYFVPDAYKARYAEHFDHYNGPLFDWPVYGPVTEGGEMVEHARMANAALVSMCDAKLGLVLDAMDQHGLWQDTMLVVWTDHGFLLGEHDCWAKCWAPFYQEVAHTPFFMWDPRSGLADVRRDALVQPSIDLAPTLLNYFGLAPTPDMLGADLAPVADSDASPREAAIFGIHGGQVNVTDGRYVYMRGPAEDDSAPLYEYTLMPTHMRDFFSCHELRGGMELAGPFSFTKGIPVLRIPGRTGQLPHAQQTCLYDLAEDPNQEHPIEDTAAEARMVALLDAAMRACDAPPEQWRRLGLTRS